MGYFLFTIKTDCVGEFKKYYEFIYFLQKNDDKIKTQSSNRLQTKKKCRNFQNSSSMRNNSEDERDMLFNDVYQTFIFPRLHGLSESNEAQMMGEQQKPKIDACNFSVVDGPLSQQLKGSMRHMRNNTKIQIKSRSSRSYSEAANHNQHRNSFGDGGICVDSVVGVKSELELPQRKEESVELLERLQREIEEEKARALQYMTELQRAMKLT